MVQLIKKVVVLGSGPSGLMAAHAADQAGYPVEIFSVKEKSRIGGAQYVHTQIPDLTDIDPDGEVVFEYRGSRAGYARKVYGDPGADVSWGMYTGTVPIWNMRRVYNELWDRFESRIINRVLLPTDVVQLQSPSVVVVSTIPRASLCWKPQEHTFASQQVWIRYFQSQPRSNKIIYNGLTDVPWYRRSYLFSWESEEYPNEFINTAPEWHDLIPVNKPLSSNCDCLGGVAKLGRYGQWKKGVLTHQVYWDAVSMFARIEQGEPHGAL